MAHEIEKFAYIGQKAWHGLGQKMEEGVPIEVWKEAAGLSHTVLESPVAYLNSYSNYETYMDNKVLYRSDTNKPLSVVSNKYQTVQPAQITGFFEGLVSELGFKMSTMGCLREGKVLFALAEIPESFSIKGDRVDGYLLLSTSYDKSMSTIAKVTSVRVVCNNTLSMAVSNAGTHCIKVGHMTKFNESQVKTELGLVKHSWEKFGQNMEALANTKLKTSHVPSLIDGILGINRDSEVSSGHQKAYNSIYELYQSGKGQDMESAKGTAWGLLNAVTEHYDHHTRNTKEKVHSKLFGHGNQAKVKAFNQLITLAA